MNRHDEFRERVIGDGFSFMESALLQAAFQINLFEAIGADTKSAQTIASEIQADARALELFLNALTSLNLIQKAGNGFKLGEAAKKIFLKSSEKYVGHAILHQNLIARSFLELPQSLHSGKPLPFSADGLAGQTAEFMREFTHAMHGMAIGHAETVAKKIELGSAKTLLDLGGGPGTFAIYFLKQNPGLQVVIFDLPTTLQTTKEYVSRYGMEDRVSYQSGNFETDKIEGTFDVIFLSHIIHGLNQEKNELLLKKLYDALNPGGKLIIHDFFLNDDKISPQFSALFALNMLLHTNGGRTYTFSEVRQWFEKTGFSEIRCPQIRLPRSISILIGRK